MSLEKYINVKYEGDSLWFEQEVADSWQMQRINRILENKDYLAGKHKIKMRVDEVYNGKTFETRKIALNYAKTLLEFETSFLLKNDVTLTSNDLEALEQYKKVYREGKYNKIDYRILSNMVRYGECYEYVYIDENKRIKSNIIAGEDSYPIYDHTGQMVAFIEYYIFDGTSYYAIYSDDKVEQYNDIDGDLHKVGEYKNLSGLPIPYVLSSELDELVGNASLREYIDILDSMEDLISKYMDSFYKFLNPIPVVKGTKLSSKDGQIDQNVVGYAMQLMDDAEFKFVNSKMDFNSFKTLWQTLKQSLLDISMTPGVSMNSQDVSNLSETSIRMLYGMAEIKGSMNSRYLHEGFEKRWGKIKALLRVLGNDIIEDAYIDCQYNPNIPQNDKEVIENLKTLKEINGISLERLLEVSPYTNDVNEELDKIDSVNRVEG
ncbi:phage portal protein [Alkaliphilus sp. B6464]|uniref:phage portal protein n=1 Tax=Alkaliphilus sp. B6464 TaxID=2731219 RepID=UPI001BA6E87C|nr:phage portal protein [Alkaliphilus sp. B6464]QUH20224.1 phage portal protein [Alkaliphilus sp. B6464]